jgi:WD40 repeat protein
VGNALHQWATATGKPRYQLKEARLIEAAAFSPDGKMVATGGWDGTLRL